MSTSSRIVSNVDSDRVDETRNIGNFEDGHFQALRHTFDQQAHAYDIVIGHNPHKAVYLNSSQDEF